MLGLPGQENPVHKVPLLGDASVGKTSIVDVMTKKIFNENTKPNVGVATANLTLNVDGKEVQLSIWDTAGQETFRSLVPLYTRNAELIILVMDVSEKSSFDSIPGWITSIRKDLALTCPIFLIANKIDIPFALEKSTISRMAEENDLTVFYTSAKTQQGVEEAFTEMGRVILGNTKSQFQPTAPKLEASKKSGCC